MAFIRTKYSKGRPYLYLVENYREGGKVRQRVLQYLGASDLISQETFDQVIDESYKACEKLGAMVHVPDLTKRIQKKTGLSKEDVHKRLYDAYIEKKIDLQPGKGKGNLIAEDGAKFQYMQPREKLGAAKKKSLEKRAYELSQLGKGAEGLLWEEENKVEGIVRALETSEFQEKEMQKRADWNQEGKREWYLKEVKREQEEQRRLRQKLKSFSPHYKLGTTALRLQIIYETAKKENPAYYGVIPIPDLWKKAKKSGMTRKEFENELLELQDKRIIDLQVHYSPSRKERREGIKTSAMEVPFYFVNWRDSKVKPRVRSFSKGMDIRDYETLMHTKLDEISKIDNPQKRIKSLEHLDKQSDIMIRNQEGTLVKNTEFGRLTKMYSQAHQELGTTKKRKSTKLGTTFSSDLQSHYNRIDREQRRGGMVPIPTIYRKMKDGYSKKEFREELLKLESERVIDLQTASDPKLIAKRDREGGFYIQDGEFFDYDERPSGGTRRGYINYIVFRK